MRFDEDTRLLLTEGLAIICPNCKGEGRTEDYYQDSHTCRECKGRGIVYTAKGEAIRALIRSERNARSRE